MHLLSFKNDMEDFLNVYTFEFIFGEKIYIEKTQFDYL